MIIKLDNPVSDLMGVGSALATRLKKLKVETVEDLIYHYPRRYDDFSQVLPISKLLPGPVTIEAQILRVATKRTRKRGFTITEALIDDGSGAIKATWFNQPYLAKSLPQNVPVYVAGNLEFKYNQYALQNPVVERVSNFTKNTARIVPVYPESEGITSKQIRGLVEQVLPLIKQLPEILPSKMLSRSLLDSIKLMDRAEALEQIHFPESTAALKRAKFRLAFEELFVLILAGLTLKQDVQDSPAPKITFNPDTAREFVNNLSFKLTDAQRKAAWQILQDMDKNTPMNRLLEGDVGSGKTVVAILAAAMAMECGYQVGILVPTEILARQHIKTLELLVSKLGYKLDLLVSGLKKTHKQSILEDVSSGKTQLIVGTHALLEESVKFKNLGLVIIDEQHRFGVAQRNQLKQKSNLLPHLLVMSATPIPRSLALTVYSDLDISIIDELPKGRRPVKTEVVTVDERPQAYRHIDAQIESGGQVFVVCPLISESDKLGVKSVEAEAERLKTTLFSHRKLAVLHGKMKAIEKKAVVEDFANGKTNILVATTVVEVGVDMPNATVMLVEGAERFGLATLHQLRGRVGRSKHQSYCYLFATSDYQSRQRLELLENYQDGFVLAQKDLELRGPGELYGQAQHGLLDLRLANLGDHKLIKQARASAEDFLRQTPDWKKYPHLLERVNQLKTVTSLD